MRILKIFAPFTSSVVLFAGSCTGIDQNLTESQKKVLAPVLAKQLKMESVEVLEIYRFGGWQIIYVDIKVSDRVFMFFKGDPLQHQYVALWSGEAFASEELKMKEWVQTKAKGIPNELATCFAWHVTQDRRQ